MFKTLANAWKIPELRKKLMFTVLVLLIYRVCSVIPVPYIDAAALIEVGVLSACPYGLKVLANGTLTKKITVKATAFSESAKEKIEQAGGKAEVV